MNSLVTRRRNHSGFTLIEVLVTMLILAVGLLGIAALQLKGLQFNHDSALRSQISNLAYDIADRMRLASSQDVDVSTTYVANYQAGGTKPATCNHATYPNTTVANSVNVDRSCWYESVDAALPPGSTANVTYSGVDDEYTVTLGWTDREGQAHNIVYTFSIL